MARVLIPTTEIEPPKATLTTSLAGSQNDLKFTARRGGDWGNSVRVRYVDPAANNQVLAVVVEGFDITVNLATGPAGAITSTAADIAAKLAADRYANQLVSVEYASSNNGTGIVTALAFTALTGGEYAVAVPAATAADATNDHYITGNEGTTIVEVTNATGSSKTVTVFYGALAAVPSDPEVVTIANGDTKALGPFEPARFNQNGAGDVYLDPSATSASLTFRAKRVDKATSTT